MNIVFPWSFLRQDKLFKTRAMVTIDAFDGFDLKNKKKKEKERAMRFAKNWTYD